MSSISSEQKKSFLNHVSGLRGVAILLVVMFHLSKRYCPHGYMGVEVFFVISGFFFLQNLQRTPDFRFWPFLVKKLRRILIPLSLLSLIVLPVSILLYPYDDLKLAATTGLTALSCISNLYLEFCSGGYFDNNSANNPLLHTWYVSALLQLFLFCGLGVMLCRRLPATVSKILIWGLGILSFLWGNMGFFSYLSTQCGIPMHFEALIPNYYNPFTRLWEFLAGGCIMLLPRSPRRAINMLWVLIGCMVVLLPALCTHPDAKLFAFLPILGTVLLIRYIPGTPLQRVWEWKPITWVGTISFSLYLTHLPFIVFYKWFTTPLLHRSTMVLLIPPMLLLAWVFYHAVERRHFKHNASWLWVGLAAVLSGIIITTNGLKGQLHRYANSLEEPVYTDFTPYTGEDLLHDYPRNQFLMWDGFLRFSNCGIKTADYHADLLYVGNRSAKPSFLLLGDSHAHYFFMGMDQVLRQTNQSGVFCTSVFIPFMNRYRFQDASYSSTREKTEALFTWLAAHPEITTLIISQRWDIRFENPYHDFTATWDNTPLPTDNVAKRNTECLAEFCQRVQAMGRQLIFVTDAPSVPSSKPIRQIRKNIILGRSIASGSTACTTESYIKHNGRDNARLDQLEQRGLCRVLHQEKHLLSDGVMQSYQNGNIMHWDWDHLTSYGAAVSVQGLKDEILFLLNQQQRANDNTNDGNHEN